MAALPTCVRTRASRPFRIFYDGFRLVDIPGQTEVRSADVASHYHLVVTRLRTKLKRETKTKTNKSHNAAKLKNEYARCAGHLGGEPTTSSICCVRLPRDMSLGQETTLGRRNFAVTGAIIWNNLPADLRLYSQSLLSFGQKLKQHLFEP